MYMIINKLLLVALSGADHIYFVIPVEVRVAQQDIHEL